MKENETTNAADVPAFGNADWDTFELEAALRFPLTFESEDELMVDALLGSIQQNCTLALEACTRHFDDVLEFSGLSVTTISPKTIVIRVFLDFSSAGHLAEAPAILERVKQLLNSAFAKAEVPVRL